MLFNNNKLNITFLFLVGVLVIIGIKNFLNKSYDDDDTKSSEDGFELQNLILGILRIQEVYGITAEQLADGMMVDINFFKKFTASDCFEVALKCKELDYHYYAIDWYKVALKRIRKEGWKGKTPEINESLALDFLAYSQYHEGSIENARAAIETTLFALNKDYSNVHSIHLAKNLNAYIEHYNALKSGLKQPTSVYPPNGPLLRYNNTELELLKKGCRGELTKTPAEQRKLYCKYEKNNHPFLLLAPIKVEVLNLSPRLVILHDVLYDSEIETLKEMSYEKLTRAGVWNQEKGFVEPSLVRTSKFAGFNNATHPIIHTLNQRVYDMTGLSMSTVEDFQIMNYKIGDYYDIHSNFFTEPMEGIDTKPYIHYHNADRIATVLFYMSDVAYGGGTIWPHINVLTLPKKGAAAFWYSLYADGESNIKSRHSACPIIAGSKWIFKKWIRLEGQEFQSIF